VIQSVRRIRRQKTAVFAELEEKQTFDNDESIGFAFLQFNGYDDREDEIVQVSTDGRNLAGGVGAVDSGGRTIHFE
jgi:hypothetical protein